MSVASATSSQPLLAGDPREQGVSTFFVSDDSIVFLRPLGWKQEPLVKGTMTFGARTSMRGDRLLKKAR